ncbi:enoyl-CoA hydratase [Mycolicibacterium insubricum]|uniref:Enoyl-CoA hydratase n=1 Tax=Mycolicibacterium insubricum TaxID=444597 RepID=A0A1X0CP36_9MYCO|nr:enoyl-CoA hydratase-related protein [Mycolicibacterium insubricum]MCV7080633.1 enoyl-CoA hydratase/isomerase family protein [Mycolicibacterium insubricum]ORA61894.1 enoyl-CoA hydratase [Mycolicibacterium insubricum]BBZ66658.1 enoyl-CoA hydratase [Mycolicibacterium insubricum]
MTHLEFHDGIAVLNLGDDENRFSPTLLDEIEADIERALEEGAQGLVTTGGGKFYSNGLDLDWVGAHSDRLEWYVGRVHDLFARVLALPVPTAAAVVGHAFGAGAMLAMSHDFRVMRTDRGFFCLPESDIRIPFTPGMTALLQAKFTPQTAVASMTTGRRFGGADALRFGIVDAVADEDAVTTDAVDLLRPLAGKDRGTLGAIKESMFAGPLAVLRG